MSAENFVECKNCSEKLEPHIQNCPKCGSNLKIFNLIVSDKISVRESITLKRKREGFSRPVLERIDGYFTSQRNDLSPEGVDKLMVIDRINKNYEEKITDRKNGRIIRDVKEDLRQHRKK